MNTARHLVSLVRADIDRFGPDRHISDRHILATLLDIINKYNSQQITQRQISGVDQVFTLIECLEMEEVPLNSCCDIESDCMIAKSKKKLPLLVDSRYGLSIRSVKSGDGKVKFNILNTPERYANTLALNPKQRKPYFFMKDGYLYITDPDVEIVKMSAMFQDLVDPSDFECGDCKPKGCKKNPLDLEIKYLPKLKSDIVSAAFQKLITKQSIPSERNSGDMIADN